MWLLVNRGEGRLAKASSLWSLEGRELAREDRWLLKEDWRFGDTSIL